MLSPSCKILPPLRGFACSAIPAHRFLGGLRSVVPPGLRPVFSTRAEPKFKGPSLAKTARVGHPAKWIEIPDYPGSRFLEPAPFRSRLAPRRPPRASPLLQAKRFDPEHKELFQKEDVARWAGRFVVAARSKVRVGTCREAATQAEIRGHPPTRRKTRYG